MVEKIAEYFGPGIKNLNIPERATVANMAPEYGATIGFFPVDEETLEYLKITNREDIAELVEQYTKANELFYSGENNPSYTEVLELDLSTIESSIAGPSRPQDRITLKQLKSKSDTVIKVEAPKTYKVNLNGSEVRAKRWMHYHSRYYFMYKYFKSVCNAWSWASSEKYY